MMWQNVVAYFTLMKMKNKKYIADNRLYIILLFSLCGVLFLIGLGTGLRNFDKYLVYNFFISRTLTGYNAFNAFIGFALSFLLFTALCLLPRINLYLVIVPVAVLCWNAFRLGAVTIVMIAGYGFSGVMCIILVYYPIYLCLFWIMTNIIIDIYRCSCGFNFVFDFQPAVMLLLCREAGKKYLFLLGVLTAYYIIVF